MRVTEHTYQLMAATITEGLLSCWTSIPNSQDDINRITETALSITDTLLLKASTHYEVIQTRIKEVEAKRG